MFLIFTAKQYQFPCIIMRWFSYLDKREVLQQEYSQAPILTPPHFRWVVSLQASCCILFLRRGHVTLLNLRAMSSDYVRFSQPLLSLYRWLPSLIQQFYNSIFQKGKKHFISTVSHMGFEPRFSDPESMGREATPCGDPLDDLLTPCAGTLSLAGLAFDMYTTCD